MASINLSQPVTAKQLKKAKTLELRLPPLHPGQQAIWDSPARFKVVSGGRRVGKALALDTPIATPDGWTTMGALRAGDRVFDDTGNVCNVVYAHDVMYGRNCYALSFMTKDGGAGSIVADAEHLWTVYAWSFWGSDVLTTEKLYKRRNNGEGFHIKSSTQTFILQSIVPVDSVPVRCITVDSPSHLYLAGSGMIPTHNTQLGVLVAMAKAATDNRGEVWWVAPTYGISSIGWLKLKRLVKPIPGVEMRESDRIVRFPNGGIVGIKSADRPDNLRGAGLVYAVLDECAYMKEETWTEVLRPALSDYEGGAMFISSPNGRNWFWRNYIEGEKRQPLWDEWYKTRVGDPPSWQCWKMPTSVSPFIKQSEIEEARQLIPERTFMQEFLAEFVEDGNGVFRNIEACTYKYDSTIGPLEGHQYVFGVDLAKYNDWTVIMVCDVNDKKVVAIDRFNMVDYGLIIGRIRALYDKWLPTLVVTECNNIGDFMVAEIRRQGMPAKPFLTTQATKENAITALSLAFERNEILIPDDHNLRNELLAFEGERQASGRMKYGAPSGLHDDMVMSLAIAWTSVTRPAPGKLFDFITVDVEDSSEAQYGRMAAD